MNFGVIVFPGANCDRDIAYILRDILQQPTRMIWHEDRDLSGIDVVVVPGGFSYGDYLRCGAIAQFSPAMQATAEHAQQGKLVMGICNGFQVLTEMGLLPGALVRNRDLHFVCDRQPLTVERTDRPGRKATAGPDDHSAHCPRRRLLLRRARHHQSLEDNRQVLFRYCDTSGRASEAANPNGSLNNIAGICNRAGQRSGHDASPRACRRPRPGQY